MSHADFEARVDTVKRLAHGRWDDILAQLQVPKAILSKRNLPCPMCQGTDRFQYTNKFGDGNYHCRGCGAGGGFKLLQAVHGWDFVTVLEKVEHCLRLPSIRPVPVILSRPVHMKHLARTLWEEAIPITPGDEVDRYLRNRGLVLQAYPETLRFHSALGYYEKDGNNTSKKVAEYPAMLGFIQDQASQLVSLHRTYLTDGHKLKDRDSKKLLCSGYSGAAIRLHPVKNVLAITEGIETALAVHLATGFPVWAALNAGNLETLWIPEEVRCVMIYGDNDSDSSFDGQASAYILARRLKKPQKGQKPREVKVFTPKPPGADWADIWRSQAKRLRLVA